jgi:hypothetical protein
MELLTIIAALAGILSFVYLMFLGQRSLLELWREKKKNKSSAATDLPSPFALAPAPAIPHNLPHRADFVGREKEKQQVHDALRSRSYLVAIDGIGGIGKTSLAREVVQECLSASQAESNNTPLNPPSRGDLSKHSSIEMRSPQNSPLEGGQGGCPLST